LRLGERDRLLEAGSDDESVRIATADLLASRSRSSTDICEE
jgi:hypothetical protein